MIYKIIAQQTPFKDNTPLVLQCEAPDETDAFLQAYSILTEKGYNVVTDLREHEAKELNVVKEKVNAIPFFSTSHMVHIRAISSKY